MIIIKSQKIIRNVIILFLLVLIILIGLIKQFNNNLKNKSIHDYSDVISYTNSLDEVYIGEILTYKIANKIQILFTTYLPSISDDLIGKSVDELRNYLKQDSERIYANIGIKDETEFIEFARGIQELGCDLDKFNEITYIEDSYIKDDYGECIKFNVVYKNDSELKCKVYVNQDSTGKVYTKYQIEK